LFIWNKSTLCWQNWLPAVDTVVPVMSALKRTVYVGGLDETVTPDLLRAAFQPFGDLLEVNIPDNTLSQKPKTFAFLEFELPEDAVAAVDNMHQSELCGKTITCSIAQAQAPVPKSKPVWSDETYMRQAQAQESAASTPSDKAENKGPAKGPTRVQSTVVHQNAPKRAKTDEVRNLTPIPDGFTRCSGCGAWGKDVIVGDTGKCNHCLRRVRP